MTEIDRWTTASSNCLGYAPDDGELVKYEDHRAVVKAMEARIQCLEESLELNSCAATLYKDCAEGSRAECDISQSVHQDDLRTIEALKDEIREIYRLRGEDPVIAGICNRALA